ncbi:uncharacterized protein L199_006470 [Kwoniella botswanensis]|uniref:uncharacterized protein n=1 Tax=Kwoniella botswanensis TaxID=1268659 RepID=UPI00315D5D75
MSDRVPATDSNNPSVYLNQVVPSPCPHGDVLVPCSFFNAPSPYYLLTHSFLLPRLQAEHGRIPVTSNKYSPTTVLTDHGLIDIKVEPYQFVQVADSPGDMARKMRPVVPILTAKWGKEKQELGRKVFEEVEEILKREQGEGPVKIWSIALVAIAKKPNE